jgi:hypothetical protein
MEEKDKMSDLLKKKLNPLSLIEYVKNKMARKSQKSIQQLNQ